MIAMKDDHQRDAALITFLATVSGMHFLGLSSVFWGICIGVIAHILLNPHTHPNTVMTQSSSEKQISKT